MPATEERTGHELDLLSFPPYDELDVLEQALREVRGLRQFPTRLGVLPDDLVSQCSTSA
jgi:hypothetical protein